MPTEIPPRPPPGPPVPFWLGWLLCRIGWHDWEVTNATFGFAPGEETEQLRCRRCGRISTRPGPV